MSRINQRGVAAFEFVLCAIPFFFLLFVVFDIGRYAITLQSLQNLADAAARAAMLCSTSTTANFNTTFASSPPTWPAACTGSVLSAAQQQSIAPFLFNGGYTVNVNAAAGAKILTVTASSNFTMMMNTLWQGKLDNPTASTTVPFSS